MDKFKKKLKAESQQARKNFKRSLKTIRLSEGWLRCSICQKNIESSKTLFVTDSRNDKYCVDCSEEILDNQIKKLKTFKDSLRDESILNELEEEDDKTKI